MIPLMRPHIDLSLRRSIGSSTSSLRANSSPRMWFRTCSSIRWVHRFILHFSAKLISLSDCGRVYQWQAYAPWCVHYPLSYDCGIQAWKWKAWYVWEPFTFYTMTLAFRSHIWSILTVFSPLKFQHIGVRSCSYEATAQERRLALSSCWKVCAFI